MKECIVLDDTEVELTTYDLDGDGVTGEVETIKRKAPSVLVPIKTQETELGESIRELKKGGYDHLGYPEVDFISNLKGIEIQSILILDSLQRLGFIDSIDYVTISKKRVQTSLNGQRSKDIVDLAVGKRKGDKPKGFFARMFNKKDKNDGGESDD